MRLRDKELKGLPVFTKSGRRVGKVAGLELDCAEHVVWRYVVTRSRSLSAILPAELLIGPDLVLEITDERMTVMDASVPQEAVALRRQEAAASLPVAMRSE